jgi:hypothetical protein
MIKLKCVKECGRLRVKILSPGYSPDANCQFPRDIRQEGREYLVPSEDISFSEMRCKFFYRVKPKKIKVVSLDDVDLKNLKIYGDEESKDCCICLTTQVDDPTMVFVIFVPCGHYCCCDGCAKKLKICPMCRATITQSVTRDQLGT